MIAITFTLLTLGNLPGGIFELERINKNLHGQLVDYTNNHCGDHRIHSNILCEKRDLYVYLPPCYDPAKKYSLIIFFHGGFGDEIPAIRNEALIALDAMMAKGCFPPAIVIFPDGAIKGRNNVLAKHSFFLNGCSGRFEDHLIEEVIPLIECKYPIQTGRESRILCGYSAGGLPAMSLGIRYKQHFSVVTTVASPLNLRYQSCSGNYFDNFSPCTFRWANKYHPKDAITKYVAGLVHIPARFFVKPIFGGDPGVIERTMKINPADLVDQGALEPGDLQILICYAGKDNFNFDAQNESFIWLARNRGIEIDVQRTPNARHSSEYCTAAQIEAFRWLASRVPASMDESTLPVFIDDADTPIEDVSIAK